MSIDKIIVLITGVLGIAYTYWFFLMKKEKTVQAGSVVDILVKGGYTPSRIKLVRGVTTKLVFTRTDQSSCLEEVVMPEFKKRVFLPLNKSVEVEITPQKEGEFEMVCGMNMYHGTLLVESQKK